MNTSSRFLMISRCSSRRLGYSSGWYLYLNLNETNQVYLSYSNKSSSCSPSETNGDIHLRLFSKMNHRQKLSICCIRTRKKEWRVKIYRISMIIARARKRIRWERALVYTLFMNSKKNTDSQFFNRKNLTRRRRKRKCRYAQNISWYRLLDTVDV
jgi:hypothetical protein